jgi:hypothetical protein
MRWKDGHKWWIDKNSGGHCGLFSGTILVWMERPGKTMKNCQIASNSAEIQTRYLQNTCLECYWCTSLTVLCSCLVQFTRAVLFNSEVRYLYYINTVNIFTFLSIMIHISDTFLTYFTPQNWQKHIIKCIIIVLWDEHFISLICKTEHNGIWFLVRGNNRTIITTKIYNINYHHNNQHKRSVTTQGKLILCKSHFLKAF